MNNEEAARGLIEAARTEALYLRERDHQGTADLLNNLAAALESRLRTPPATGAAAIAAMRLAVETADYEANIDGEGSEGCTVAAEAIRDMERLLKCAPAAQAGTGAAAMRVAAAKVAHDAACEYQAKGDHVSSGLCEWIANAIRALPAPEVPEADDEYGPELAGDV